MSCLKRTGSRSRKRLVDEVLTSSEGAEVIRHYGEILRTHEPQYRRGGVVVPGREHVPCERIVFPLAKDGEHVDMLILVYDNLSP